MKYMGNALAYSIKVGAFLQNKTSKASVLDEK